MIGMTARKSRSLGRGSACAHKTPPGPRLPSDHLDGQRAQPGHAANLRPPFAPEQIDAVQEYRLPCCPDCGGDLDSGTAAPRVVPQVELVERPIPGMAPLTVDVASALRGGSARASCVGACAVKTEARSMHKQCGKIWRTGCIARASSAW